MFFDEEKILSELELEDITEPQHRTLAEIIGVDNFVKLIMYAGGDCYYIPTATKFKTTLLTKFIKKSKKSINSFSRRELVRKYGVCRKTVDEAFASLRGEKR